MTTKILLTTLALTSALHFAGSAQAAPSAEPAHMSMRVSVADLDLHRPAGSDVALRRIHHAAVVICGDEPQSAGLRRYGLFRGCVKTTVRNAMASHDTQLARGPDAGRSYVETVLAANR